MTNRRIEVLLYDTIKFTYTRAEWDRLGALILEAETDGYKPWYGEYMGQPLASMYFNNEADAALFKLKYF